jgi:hypothetical protein
MFIEIFPTEQEPVMSRRTVTLTAPNGATVRTAVGKRFYVVAFGTQRASVRYDPDQGKIIVTKFDQPREVAKVVRRTDSGISAASAQRKHNDGRTSAVVFGLYRRADVSGTIYGREYSAGELRQFIDAERTEAKKAKAAR